jgi:hypothetical protein
MSLILYFARPNSQHKYEALSLINVVTKTSMSYLELKAWDPM